MKVGPVQQIALIALAPIIALATGVGVAFTRPDKVEVHTVVLHGLSTMGADGEMPIQIVPQNVIAGDDGSIGLGYEYLANGQATGSLAGSFTYVERGYIFLADPTDPTSMVGDRFTGGSFTLYPAGGPVAGLTVEDRCVECYEHGVESGKAADVPSWARALVAKIAVAQATGGVAVQGEPVAQYGYFTFTTSVGTFKGYATPDFREFVIQVRFQSSEAQS